MNLLVVKEISVNFVVRPSVVSARGRSDPRSEFALHMTYVRYASITTQSSIPLIIALLECVVVSSGNL
jgi:hypothetical protein